MFDIFVFASFISVNFKSFPLQFKLNIDRDPNIFVYNTIQFISFKRDCEDSVSIYDSVGFKIKMYILFLNR